MFARGNHGLHNTQGRPLLMVEKIPIAYNVVLREQRLLSFTFWVKLYIHTRDVCSI